ncbi:peroxiredoxin [Pleionea sp. CnH1-48]|uniref:peroxiredoxin family protein n=1 Tax=Pleionea sp. CnH1-48 TaxID=2954494 RepID=UPI0020974758|nr:redoxin family protein [Pleionea sp. CnH1-48]MCO7225827.1 redoxin family protein [Pleionea sp. CnH1-48]
MLKSLFISVYLTLLVVTTSQSLYHLFLSFSAFWLLVLLANGVMLGFFARLFLFPTARTGRLIILHITQWGLGLAIVMSHNTIVPAILYGVGLPIIGSSLYIFWYSHLDRQSNELLVSGKTLPDFELITIEGQKVEVNQWLPGQKLILFYRGNWCPLCMAQIDEIALQYQQLNAMGFHIVLVSPQPHKFTVKLAAKYDVPFYFMQDEAGNTAKQLGIYAQQGTPKGMELLGYESDTVLPTVLATDKNNKIIFVDLTDNYRIRPEPKVFIEMIREHQQAMND